MKSEPLNVFSWGYRNWGNATDKLVEAVDTVEASRGRGPPLFVDIRASRKVRALGFREDTFAKRFGPSRYRWIQGLGNKAILEGEGEWELIDPSAAAELLKLAEEMQTHNRRVIFFCACLSPTANCHRHMVAPELKRVAKALDRSVTVVEWPGFENEPASPPVVTLDPKTFKSLRDESSRAIPLGEERPAVPWLALPWYSVARFEAPELSGFMFTGPAQFRAGRWIIEFLGRETTLEKAKITSKRARMETLLFVR